METGELVLLGLLGGAGVWFLLRKPAAATTPAPAPCNVGGSYAGFGASISCSEAEKIVNGLGNSVETAATNVFGSGTVKSFKDFWGIGEQLPDYDVYLKATPLSKRAVDANNLGLALDVHGEVIMDDKTTRLGPVQVGATHLEQRKLTKDQVNAVNVNFTGDNADDSIVQVPKDTATFVDGVPYVNAAATWKAFAPSETKVSTDWGAKPRSGAAGTAGTGSFAK